jgi:CHAD domain-containing protein
VRDAARRCAREQLEEAVRQLSEEVDNDPVTAVHEARKAVKKERALLRLLRGALAKEQRDSANTTLRDAARGLSGVRDADVMIETVDRLADRFAGQLPEATYRAVSEMLEATRRLENRASGAATPSREAAQDLAGVLVRIDDWELRRGGWAALDDGLRRSYGRGHKAFRHAREDRSLESLHEWRKRVKDLWYHLRLLQPVCGRVVRGQVKTASRLADVLGGDHDLAVLNTTLDEIESDLAVDVDALRALIDHSRNELQTEAMRAGERLYAETPKQFARRMHRYWKAGRAQARAELDRQPGELAHATRTPHALA